MKLSRLGDVMEWDERREVVDLVLAALRKPIEVRLEIGDLTGKELITRDDAPEVFAALDQYFAEIKTWLEQQMRAAGVEVDEGHRP